MTERVFRLPRLQFAALGLLSIVHRFVPELGQPRIFANHRVAWTTGGAIEKILWVNRKKMDTQKVSVIVLHH